MIGANLGALKPPVPTWQTVGYDIATNTTAVMGYVTRTVSVIQAVRVLQEIIYPVQWYRFEAAGDERTCPECGGANGVTWPEGQSRHPNPPLHVNCRCRIVPDRIELRRRYEWGWANQVVNVAVTTYQQIGTRTTTTITERKGWVYAV